MQHTESSVKVYFTKEYDRFQTITGNRQLSEPKIKRIIKDIESGLDVLRFCPVIVSEKEGRLQIIDGQHRFYVARKLKSHVWYIIAEDLSLLEIARINSNTEKWKDKDFINCYVQQGNQHYEILRDFQEETGFPLSTCMIMLTRGMMMAEGSGTTGMKPRFQQGQFEVKELEKARETAKKVKMFQDFPGHTSGAFIEAISRILKAGKIDVADLYIKWSKDPKQLTKQGNGKEYLNALELIYNQNARVRKVIY